MLTSSRPRRADRARATRLASCVAGLLVLAPLAPAARAQEPTAAQAVAAAVADMEGADAAAVFSAARALDRLGAAGVEPVRGALPTAGTRARLGLARYLLGQNERQSALDALVSVVSDEDPEAAVLAAEMIERYARTRREVQGLSAALESSRDPSVKIAVAKALRAKARDTDAERILKDYLKSEDFDVRAMAALALGELDNIEPAKAVLTELSEEPTERGKRARAILYQEKLLDSLRRTQGLDPSDQVKLLEGKVKELQAAIAAAERARAAGESASPGSTFPKGQALLDELSANIKRYYADEVPELEDKALFDAAAKGMVASLDPFSSYMTEDETRQFRESMSGKYAGIGAVVSMDPKDKLLTIIRPIYSGPAYKAGLRSLDKITQVEGESTYGKTVEELVTRLKGDSDTEVNIKVYRKGWKAERDIVLKRAEIQLESVHYAMLPGSIGYLQLAQFGDNATRELEAALVDLERQGMKGLVLDLRANPGGLLTAAVDISDKFLKDDKLIVYSQGRNPHIAPRREYRTREASTHPDYPMVILVNKASASASEIVAGALQEHGRAILVGEGTFGKGSVQQLLKVRTTDNESTLRLTIAKYYLPSGRSIHRDPKTKEGGVQPDIVVEEEARPSWEIEEVDRVRESGRFDPYVEKLWEEHKDLMRELATFDGSDPSRYPGLEELHASLGTALPIGQLRAMTRAQIRRFVQDEIGREFSNDLQEDLQLQRAVYETLKRVGGDPAEHAEYHHFATKFAEVPKEAIPDAQPR